MGVRAVAGTALALASLKAPMAPIPLVLDEETSGLIDNLYRREKDLVEYQIPRLRDCKGPLSAQQRLAAELKEDLDGFAKQVELLEIRAEDAPRKSDRQAIFQLVEGFRESNSRIRKEMRAALLHSKKVIDTQAKSNREDLFTGARAVADSRNVEEKATDDALMKASNDVTEALRRTMGLMQSELERSVLSHQILEKSTSSLRSTSAQHDILSSATHTSKQLITALERSDWLDRLLILTALSFFFLIVLFILKQRIVDRGVRLAFWWTRFLPSFSPLPDAIVGLEKGNGAKMSAIVSSEVTSAVKTGTKVVEDTVSTVSTVLVQTSPTSAAADSFSIVSDIASEVFTSSLSTAVESATSTSLADTLSPFTPSTVSEKSTAITTTALDALTGTLSAVQHSEL